MIFFVNIGLKLAAKIESVTKKFNTYFCNYNPIILKRELTDEEFKNAFFH